MKPKLTIYVTRNGTKYSVNMPIESPVRLQREMYFIAETIGEAAEKVEQKPKCTFGVITIRFKYDKNGSYSMNCDYKINRTASVTESNTTLELYKSLVEALSENDSNKGTNKMEEIPYPTEKEIEAMYEEFTRRYPEHS